MKKLARFILLCLIMIVIPVQGIAAAAMSCGDRHDQPVSASSVSADKAASGQNESGAPVSHEDAVAKNDTAHCTDCADCAECCVGCAMTMACCNKVAPEPSSKKVSLLFPSYFGHVSSGLERPPKA